MSALPLNPTAFLLVGGSFDPPHRAHLNMALHAASAAFPGLAADVLFIPAARSPLKAAQPHATDQQRLDMLALLLARAPRTPAALPPPEFLSPLSPLRPNLHIYTIELDRANAAASQHAPQTTPPPPSFTIDTVRQIRGMYPSTPIRMLIGADQAVAFHRWRQATLLFSLAPPVVAPRAPLNTPAALRAAIETTDAWTPAQLDIWASSLLTVPVLDISSTKVRHALAEHPRSPESARLLADALGPQLLAYIDGANLYQSGPHGGS